MATASQSYASKRMEAVDMMIKVMQYAPESAKIILPYIFKYSDFEGAQEIYNKIEEETAIANQQMQPPIPQQEIGNG